MSGHCLPGVPLGRYAPCWPLGFHWTCQTLGETQRYTSPPGCAGGWGGGGGVGHAAEHGRWEEYEQRLEGF